MASYFQPPQQPAYQFTVCDVCRLIDGDTTLKPCQYCGQCDAWICSADLRDWGRRIMASIIKRGE